MITPTLIFIKHSPIAGIHFILASAPHISGVKTRDSVHSTTGLNHVRICIDVFQRPKAMAVAAAASVIAGFELCVVTAYDLARCHSFQASASVSVREEETFVVGDRVDVDVCLLVPIRSGRDC